MVPGGKVGARATVINLLFLLVVGSILLSYGGLNYYIGLRGWQAIGSYLPFLPAKVYWVVFWLMALSYLLGRLGDGRLPTAVSRWLVVIGAYWLAAMFYFFLILVLIDLVHVLDKPLGFLPAWLSRNPGVNPAFGWIVFLAVVGVVIYGSWNARHPRVVRYDLTIPKPAGGLKQLHAVMVSDIHLGVIVNSGRLQGLVEMVNGLNPDIVLMPGDIIDESVQPFIEQQMAATLRWLRPKYGVFAILGNHEYIGGHADEAVGYLREAGVRVLRDQWVKVAESFYLVGRDNGARHRFPGAARQPLSAVMAGVDRAAPVLLMDHEPIDFQEAAAARVDLQLSGHTHLGQLFPNNLVTRHIYEDDWGLLRKGDFQVLVSCGFGTWGPPIRVGNRPEVVDILIRFEG